MLKLPKGFFFRLTRLLLIGVPVFTLSTKFLANSKNISSFSCDSLVFCITVNTKGATPAKTPNQIIKKKSPFDTYHINNYGRVSWYDFSKKICEKLDLKIKIKGVNSNNNLVRRPLDSSMVSINLKRIGIKQKSWEMGLDEYLIERGYINA